MSREEAFLVWFGANDEIHRFYLTIRNPKLCRTLFSRRIDFSDINKNNIEPNSCRSQGHDQQVKLEDRQQPN